MLENGKHDPASTHHLPHVDEKTHIHTIQRVMDYNTIMH